jgi:putative intracellular protease/amidase
VLVDNTGQVGEIDVSTFDAIVGAGGQAPMLNFAAATDLHAKFVEFYMAGKVTAALCHGMAILKFVRLPNGEYLAKGRTVTGFAVSSKTLPTTPSVAMGCCRATGTSRPGASRTR